MLRQLIAVVVLGLLATSSWGVTLRSFWQPPVGQPPTESAGTVDLTVQIERDSGDPAGACLIDVDVSAVEASGSGFDIATAGVDFVALTTTVNFDLQPNDQLLETTVPVTVNDDALVELTETFDTLVSNFIALDCVGFQVAVDPATQVPVFDDDTGSLLVVAETPSIQVNEGAGTLTLLVGIDTQNTVAPGVGLSAEVQWTAQDGTATQPEDWGDGSSGSGILQFNSPGLTATIILPINEDTLPEGNEGFQVTFQAPIATLVDDRQLDIAIATPTVDILILDNEASNGDPAFAGTQLRFDESSGTATVVVDRVDGASGVLNVNYSSADGTATAGVDYTAVTGTLTWPDGDTSSRTFAVPLLDDALVEGDENLILTLVAEDAPNSPITTSLVITDDEAGSFVQFAAASADTEEFNGSVVLTLSRAGDPSGAVSVDYVTEDGSATAGEDYVAATGTVSWADGDGTDKTITIALIQDGMAEDAEDFSVRLQNLIGDSVLTGNTVITVNITASSQGRNISGIDTLTPNQRSLGLWFDNTCPEIAGLGALTEQSQDLSTICALVRDDANTDAQVALALDAINPEELFVAPIHALRLTAVQHGNLNQRLNALRSGASGIDIAGLSVEIDGQVIAGSVLQEIFNGLVGGGASADDSTWGRWGGFMNGRISSGDKDASDNESGFDYDLWGVTTGVDFRFRQNVIGGASLGYTRVETDYQGNRGGLDIDSWNGSVFLTYFRDNAFYLDALASVGSNDYDSIRRIQFDTASSTVDRTARGNTDGLQYSAGLGLGWDYNVRAFTFGPHLGAYFFNVDVDGFGETGSGGLELLIDDQSAQSMTANLGGHLSYALLTRWGVLVPQVRMDWVHEFEDNRETMSFRFLHDPFTGSSTMPSAEITLQSDRPDPDYFLWSVGLSAQLIYGISGFLTYQGYAGYENASIGEFSGGVRWEKTF